MSKIYTAIKNLLIYAGYFVVIYLTPLHHLLCEGDVLEDAEAATGGRRGFVIIPAPFYTPETKLGLAIGAVYYSKAAKQKKTDNIRSYFIFTQEKQVYTAVAFDKYTSGFRINTELIASKYPSSFYGIGPDALKADKETYTPTRISLNPNLIFMFLENTYLGLTYSIAKFKISQFEPGGLIEQGDEITGTDYIGKDPILESGFGLKFLYDSRNYEFYPTKGLKIESTLTFYSKAFGSDHNFLTFENNVKIFFPIYRNKHILALHGILDMTSGDVPLQMYPKIGGRRMHRGFIEGRFMDKNMLTAQVEYRYPIYYRLKGVLFTAAGNVFDKFGTLKREQVKISYGLGLRLTVDKSENINIRCDLGFGHGDRTSLYDGIYVMILEAF